MRKIPETKILLLQLSLLASPLLLYFFVPKCLGPNEYGRYVRVLANPMLFLGVAEVLLSSAAVKCPPNSQLLKRVTIGVFAVSFLVPLMALLTGGELKNTLLAALFQLSTLVTALWGGPFLKRNQLNPYVAAKVSYICGLGVGLPFCKTAEQALVILCGAHVFGSLILGFSKLRSKPTPIQSDDISPDLTSLFQSGLLLWMLNLPFTASVSLAALTLDNASLASFRIVNSAVTAAFYAFPPVQLLWADTTTEQLKKRFASHITLVIIVSILGAIITPIFTTRYLGFSIDLWMDGLIFTSIPIYLAVQRLGAIYQKEARPASLSTGSFLFCMLASAAIGYATRVYLAPTLFPVFYLVCLSLARSYSLPKGGKLTSPVAQAGIEEQVTTANSHDATQT